MGRSERIPSIFVVASLMFIGGVFGGVLSVFTICFSIWLSHRSLGLDLIAKHGISVQAASRLGGVAIVSSLLFYVIFSFFVNADIFQFLNKEHLIKDETVLALVLGCALVGLLEDFGFSLKPVLRLFIFFVLTLSAYIFDPLLLPNSINFFGENNNVLASIFLIVGSCLVYVGFINAGNMVDGANGLLSIVAMIFFAFVYKVDGDGALVILIIAIFSFALVNLCTGNIILGDFGAYGLSGLIVLSSFDLYDNYNISVWVFASILSYPCFEIVRAILYRFYKGQSLVKADNDHLHNKLFNCLLSVGQSNLVANSCTGVLLALISAGFPYGLTMLVLPTESNVWLAVFLVEILVLSALWKFLPMDKNKLSERQ